MFDKTIKQIIKKNHTFTNADRVLLIVLKEKFINTIPNLEQLQTAFHNLIHMARILTLQLKTMKNAYVKFEDLIKQEVEKLVNKFRYTII